MQVIARSLPNMELEGMREMFKEMDQDNSSTITVAELREGLKRKGAEIALTEVRQAARARRLPSQHSHTTPTKATTRSVRRRRPSPHMSGAPAQPALRSSRCHPWPLITRPARSPNPRRSSAS